MRTAVYFKLGLVTLLGGFLNCSSSQRSDAPGSSGNAGAAGASSNAGGGAASGGSGNGGATNGGGSNGGGAQPGVGGSTLGGSSSGGAVSLGGTSTQAGSTGAGLAGGDDAGGSTDNGSAEDPSAAGGSAGSAAGGSGGKAAGGSAAGGNAGAAGDDGGPSCAGGQTPLVWLILSSGSGMFGDVVVGEVAAFEAVRSALTGAGGLLRELSNVHFGLTLFDGVAKSTCPRVATFTPKPDSQAIEAAILAVPLPTAKQESPLSDAYAEAVALVRQRPESDRTIVIIANSVPDFCDDGSTICARDRVIGQVQAAFAEGIRTELVGFDHPLDAPLERAAYLQALANAGRGAPAVAFIHPLVIASCSNPAGTYAETGGSTDFVLGNAASTDFDARFRAKLRGLACP